MADEVSENIRKHRVLIVNTDLSGGQGIHWICLFNEGKPDVIAFDPLGPENKRSNWNVIVEQIHAAGKGVRLMPNRTQAKKSTHCGWMSLAASQLGPDALSLIFADLNKATDAVSRTKTALGNVKQLIRMFGFQE